MSWSDVSFDLASAERDAGDDGDELVWKVLRAKKDALHQRLTELRQELKR